MYDLRNALIVSKVNTRINTLSAPTGPLDQILTATFYPCVYACPICGKMLFKTVCAIGGEILLKNEENEDVLVKRIFTCDHCNLFLFAIPGYNLGATNYVYGLRFDSENYKFLLDRFTEITTTDGRSDN